MGETDPQLKASHADLDAWLRKLYKDDPILKQDVDEVYEYIRKSQKDK